MEKRYRMEPAPRLNPEGRLDGAFVVYDTTQWANPNQGARGRGLTAYKVVARFKVDGRDKAEAWIAARVQHDEQPESCRNCENGACCTCGSLSPWRCGCPKSGLCEGAWDN